MIYCGDFNAHNTSWGSGNNESGMVMEELMENKNLVCLNNGKGTRTVLKDGEITAAKDEEKAEMLAKTLKKIHSSDNISEAIPKHPRMCYLSYIKGREGNCQ